jgi:hypothetical protein
LTTMASIMWPHRTYFARIPLGLDARQDLQPHKAEA